MSVGFTLFAASHAQVYAGSHDVHHRLLLVVVDAEVLQIGQKGGEIVSRFATKLHRRLEVVEQNGI